MRLVRAAIHKNRSKGKGRRSKSKDAKSDPPPPPPGLGGDLDELLLAGSATPVRTLPFAANSPPYIALHRLSRPFLCLSQPFHRLSPLFDRRDRGRPWLSWTRARPTRLTATWRKVCRPLQQLQWAPPHPETSTNRDEVEPSGARQQQQQR